MTFYLTTPIYYVNASPHLGHAYTTIVADVIARYRRLHGNETFFLTGTDEHGVNVAQAAEAAAMDPQTFADRNSQRFRDLLPLLDASPDFFVRTTDAGHRAFVQGVLQRIYERGHIFQDSYSGLYCAACEAYYTPGDLLDGELCPVHHTKTVSLNETNWFFRLSAFEQPLLEHFRANPDWVAPRVRYNEAISFIEGGLQDLSISRASLRWGVPVPWDPEQVIYVWADALFNYASALTYGAGDDVTAKFWPPTLQLLAKDILKFHAVIWPALLLAAGMELPKKLLIHGYLLMGGEKMSKTRGNVFDPFPILHQHGADPVRFYLLRDVQLGQDGTVSQEAFEQRYNSELANELGNLVSRTVSMVGKYRAGTPLRAAPSDSSIGSAVARMQQAYRAQMDDDQLTGALESVWVVVRELNRLVEERTPWALAKQEADDTAAGELLDATLAELCEGIVAVAAAVAPFMPTTGQRIAGVFARDVEGIIGAQWGDLAGVVPVPLEQPLFPRIQSSVEA